MSFPGQLPIIIHLEIGSLVPPCPHMAGPRSPFPLCYLDKDVGFLVPRSKASSPVPVPRPPFRFLVPRSGSSSPVPVPRSLFTDLSQYHNLRALMSWVVKRGI